MRLPVCMCTLNLLRTTVCRCMRASTHTRMSSRPDTQEHVCVSVHQDICLCVFAYICMCSPVVLRNFTSLKYPALGLFNQPLFQSTSDYGLVQFCSNICVCPSFLVWFWFSGSQYTESDNLSEVFCFGSDSILSIISPSAPNVCMCHTWTCDYLHWLFHS